MTEHGISKRLRPSGQKGVILPMIMLLILVLLILTPALVFHVQQETRTAIQQKRSTNAFYAAEAGVDRALWLLKNSSSTFNDIVNSGGVPEGYLGETVYDDVEDAAYRITLSSTAIQKEVRIVSDGRDADDKEFRSIEVLVSKEAIQAAIYAPTISAFGAAKVYWGPLMATGNMQIQGGANELYPRKYSRGAIDASGGSYPARDTSPAGLNTDGLEWWSYNYPPGVPDPPSVDLEYYKNEAKGEVGCPGKGDPLGSCYYPNDEAWAIDSMDEKSYYFEGDAKFTSQKHFRGVMIVMGDLEMGGGATCASGGFDYGEYTVTPPFNAWKEYQKNTPAEGNDCSGNPCTGGGSAATDDGDYDDGDDAEGEDACCDEYPGDAGLRTVENYTFKGGCASHSDLGGGPADCVSFKGFVYVVGDTKLVGGTLIHGSFMSVSGSFSGGGNLEIFYDDDLDVKMINENFTQTSWKELVARPF